MPWIPLQLTYSQQELKEESHQAPFLDLDLSITNSIVPSKIYDKRYDFNFEIINFPFLHGDVPCSPSYGVYILKQTSIRFERVCCNILASTETNL